MDVEALTQARNMVWLYLAGPALLIAAVILSVRLRLPQWRRLPDAVRALRSRGEGDTEGATSPGLAAMLAAGATFGAAALVGAAIAISLGGPGALPYLWLFGVLFAPIVYAETLLAKTDAPGGGDPDRSGSLARRLVRMGNPWRPVGFALAGLVAVVACLYGGAVHGAALAAATRELLPGSTPVLMGAAAVMGALLSLDAKRTAGLAGWLAVAGIAVVLVACVWAIGANPGAAFGALGRSFGAALEGSPRAAEFSGAFAGEVAFAAVLFLLPPLGATAGVQGALQGLSRGRVKVQAALSLLGPLVFAIVGTVLVMAMAGTGAYGERAEGSRVIMDARFYKVAAATASERLDESRLYDGYVRIRDGKPRNPHLLVGSERGMIKEPRFEYNGRTADVALQVAGGRAFRLMRNSSAQALSDVDTTNLWRLTVHGEMLPTGGALAMQTARSAGGDLAARLLLAALLALAAVAFAGFGLAARRSLPADAPAPARIVMGLLPAVGVGLVAGGWLPGLPQLGAIAAGLLAVVVSVVLMLRHRELHKLEGATRKAAPKAPAAHKTPAAPKASVAPRAPGTLKA